MCFSLTWYHLRGGFKRWCTHSEPHATTIGAQVYLPLTPTLRTVDVPRRGVRASSCIKLEHRRKTDSGDEPPYTPHGITATMCVMRVMKSESATFFPPAVIYGIKWPNYYLPTTNGRKAWRHVGNNKAHLVKLFIATWLHCVYLCGVICVLGVLCRVIDIWRLY